MKQFRSALKERVVNETVPIQKIYEEEIIKANFSPEILALVPLPQHMRMTVVVELPNISFYSFL